MKKHRRFSRKYFNLGSVLASIALVFCTISANSICYYIFHQSKRPEGLEQLRKF